MANFPGAQPVSFQEDGLFALQNEEYIVAEKSDGQRYLLVETINPADMFIVDRKYRILRVYARFILNYKSNKRLKAG
jgi:hypothetical protein